MLNYEHKMNNLNLRFDGTNFVTAASTNHPHRETSLGKMNEGLIAISGDSSDVEVESFANGNWNNQPPFPWEKMSYYSTVTYQNLLYVFGESYLLISSISKKTIETTISLKTFRWISTQSKGDHWEDDGFGS